MNSSLLKVEECIRKVKQNKLIWFRNETETHLNVWSMSHFPT